MASPARKNQPKVATNRKALRDYFVLNRVESGIALRGTEVKSIRAGHINLVGGYAKIEGGEIVLHGVNITPYEYGNQFNHVADRPRRLLLHRREIDRFAGQIAQKGHTLIPLNCYLKRGRVKIELGLCRGRQDPDKREQLRRQDADREARRVMAQAR